MLRHMRQVCPIEVTAAAHDAVCDIPEPDRGPTGSLEISTVNRIQKAGPVGGMTIARCVG